MLKNYPILGKQKSFKKVRCSYYDGSHNSELTVLYIKYLTLPKTVSCCNNKLADSVFPDPDSPLIIMHWLVWLCIIAWYVKSAIAYICGGFSFFKLFSYFLDHFKAAKFYYLHHLIKFKTKKYLFVINSQLRKRINSQQNVSYIRIYLALHKPIKQLSYNWILFKEIKKIKPYKITKL